MLSAKRDVMIVKLLLCTVYGTVIQAVLLSNYLVTQSCTYLHVREKETHTDIVHREMELNEPWYERMKNKMTLHNANTEKKGESASQQIKTRVKLYKILLLFLNNAEFSLNH